MRPVRRDHAPVRVGDASGAEDQITWPRLELCAADGEEVLALQDEKQLIVIVVDVQRRVEGVDLFDDRERAAH
jgi:hypothetical protein